MVLTLPVTNFNRLYIDSLDQLTSSTSSHANFQIQFPQSLQGCTSAEVENAVIPYVCDSPNIPYYMGNLYFDATGNGITRRYVATIPTNCTYTLASLVSAVNASLQFCTLIAASDGQPPGAVDDLRTNLVFTLNNGLPGTLNPNKIQFATTNLTAFSFVPYGQDRTAVAVPGFFTPFIFHNLSFRLGYGMPYDIGSYLNTSAYVSAGGSWALPSIQRSKYFLITSDFSRQAYSTLGGSAVGRYDVLAKVYVGSAQYGDTVSLSSQAVSRYVYTIVPSQSISTINIQVLDDEGELVDIPRYGAGSVSVSLLFTH